MQMEISSFFLNMQHSFAYKSSSNFSLQQGLAANVFHYEKANVV